MSLLPTTPESLDDQALREQMTALTREYARRYELRAATLGAPVDGTALSATEVVIVASELIRAADLNLFDVAMWFRRPLPVWNDDPQPRADGV
jgi:hypothetical protein